MGIKRVWNKRVGFWVAVIFLIALAGVFLWYIWTETEGKRLFVETKDFEIKELQNGKAIEYKNLGFSVKLLEGWDIEELYNEFYFKSPDYEHNAESKIYTIPIPQKGCLLTMSIRVNDKERYEYLKEILDTCSNSQDQDCEYDVIEISDRKSLMNSERSEKIKILHSIIYLMDNFNIYTFELYSSFIDEDNCKKYFDSFLEGVEIKK